MIARARIFTVSSLNEDVRDLALKPGDNVFAGESVVVVRHDLGALRDVDGDGAAVDILHQYTFRPSIPALQDRHERFLRDVDAADALHALLALFLLLQQLALARDVAAVAFGGDVFADGLDRLAGDDLAADRGLQRDLEEVAVDFFLQADEQLSAAGLGVVAVDDRRSARRRGRR
jgi:hypothetical protein